jgi:hypothetical protein
MAAKLIDNDIAPLQRLEINKYLPFAFIYFFVNSLALPFGLTYTAILSPLFYYWVVTLRKREILIPFFVCLIPFFIAHAILGVETKAYIISIINYTAVYIFCQSVYAWLKECRSPENIFNKLFIVNFSLCLIGAIVFFTPFRDILWMRQAITDGVDNFSRLKLFTYEASYYATIFTPLFFFYFLQLIFKQNKMNSWLLLFMLFLPYVLSFSIGVIVCILLALIITYITHFIRLTKKPRVLSLLALAVLVSGFSLIILWLFFPGNIIFLRLENILAGKDTSGNGRTYEAFMLASRILEQKSLAWGVGAGQIKILGADIIRSYYLYDLDYNTIAIPNAAAETLAIFGWVGLSIRLFIEVFLFFYTRVYTNYFRLLLFIFIFIYQFTGSFITNVAEYVIWIMAFTNVFFQFDVKNNKRLANN